ncbi:SPFH domain-containing protein [Nocardia cyriacigeorgica]|uniref:SPFH domain-containing protein n=1 Tax=Nocardia cyriacigeorgica TaxID=135487 RepID=UPI001895AFE0|nr:SPFH domain-containing protein [Nocardia cyriacigeorgica]MBF6427304.1 SPFH domain-containing protein [Nocardia cyriacigeorgica]BDU05270.1 virion core protein [Nocardia cyriacigeorgica]
MAWFEREFIAVPESAAGQLVYKWPDVNIRRYSRAIVNADQTALFVKAGQVVATMGPGRHRIDADELPVLGALVDTLSGGNFYRAELYFVSTREFAGLKFGGRLADIADPASQQVVTLRVFGEFALAVRDPGQLIVGLAGTADLTDPAALNSWCADLLLKSMKIAVTQGVSRGDWPVLGLSAHLLPIETAVLRQTNITLYEYGLRIVRMGNFDITLAPEDADRLKRLAKDVTYIKLAGDFRQYAAGELALGASQGFAHGGTGSDSGFLGAALGLNMINQQTGPPPQPLPAPQPMSPAPPSPETAALPAPTAQQACPECATDNPAKARFCMHCGHRLTSQPRHCGSCGAELGAAARFCGDCGSPTGS